VVVLLGKNVKGAAPARPGAWLPPYGTPFQWPYRDEFHQFERMTGEKFEVPDMRKAGRVPPVVPVAPTSAALQPARFRQPNHPRPEPGSMRRLRTRWFFRKRNSPTKAPAWSLGNNAVVDDAVVGVRVAMQACLMETQRRNARSLREGQWDQQF
jgi:hypothetical protein